MLFPGDFQATLAPVRPQTTMRVFCKGCERKRPIRKMAVVRVGGNIKELLCTVKCVDATPSPLDEVLAHLQAE